MWDFLLNLIIGLLKAILGIVAFILVVGIPISIIERIRLKRLARKRAGLSICQFARSFNYRRIDTKIIRAVYEGFQDWVGSGIKNFPVVASDDIAKVYRMGDEDLDEFAEELASKTHRRWGEFEINPLYGRVKTVEDLVLLLHFQPKAVS